ncbi:MAG: polysaccharide biosynthesis tyrosine autokinase, partial [bacterium]|nr:polysaccharide biosynthesis tyrosine autokinase [bacterium]
EVERDPLILDVKSRIASLEQTQQSLLANGYNREHRYFKSLQSQIDGANVNLEDTRRTLLNDRFTSQLDTIRNVIGQRQAQESRLNQNKSELTVRRTNLTRIQSTLDDIRRQIDDSLSAKAEATSKLEEIKMLDSLANANRVIVVQAERPPTEMAFPKLAFMMPLGVILMVGLVGGSVLLRELLDQRVKGPADVFMIPRTRLVGWIPDAAEDPAGQGAVETAFRDRPRGVVAESYRQIRSSLTKRLETGGHKSIMVMSGIPGSGSTATVANLGLAFAATDKRVLIVDANLRRPGLHRVFGLQESPGLADVLGKSVSLADAVQATSTPNLSVLTVGAKDARLPERLGNDAVSAFLAEAKASYDIILLDAPPAIVAGDGTSLAHRCDAALLVVKAFGEKRGLVARVRNELSDMKGEFLGVVVNSVRSAAGGYMRGNFKAAQDYQQQG